MHGRVVKVGICISSALWSQLTLSALSGFARLYLKFRLCVQIHGCVSGRRIPLNPRFDVHLDLGETPMCARVAVGLRRIFGSGIWYGTLPPKSFGPKVGRRWRGPFAGVHFRPLCCFRTC